MAKTQKELDHQADMSNRNEGTSGTNKTLDHNQGNRGKQLDPKQDNAAKKK